jgi:hypothetical protein
MGRWGQDTRRSKLYRKPDRSANAETRINRALAKADFDIQKSFVSWMTASYDVAA